MEAPSIHFTPLQKKHFSLLLKWLETPHVKAWWDQEIHWTPELIEEKYGSYVHEYKVEKGIKKPLQAYIIYLGDMPAGYIQLYNAYDFPREESALPETLPKSLGALDFYIGDPHLLGKGLAPLILNQFLQNHVRSKFNACFVDPDKANQKAIRAYEKAGFKIFPHFPQGKAMWMIKKL